jgi:hypothetical protein
MRIVSSVKAKASCRAHLSGLASRLLAKKHEKDGGNWELRGRASPISKDGAQVARDAAVSSRLRRAFVALAWSIREQRHRKGRGNR